MVFEEALVSTRGHQSPRRILSFEIMRIIAVVLVVAVHVFVNATVSYLQGESILGLRVLLNLAGNALAVNSFLFISGFFLLNRSYKKSGYRSFAARKTKEILLPYIIWSVIYSLRVFARGNASEIASAASFLVEILQNLVTGGAYYHLYFVPPFFVLTLLAPYLAPLFKKRPSIVVPLGIVLSLATTLCAKMGLFQWAHINLFASLATGLVLGVIRFLPMFLIGGWYSYFKKSQENQQSSRSMTLAVSFAAFLGTLIVFGFAFVNEYRAPSSLYLVVQEIAGFAAVLCLAIFLESTFSQEMGSRFRSMAERLSGLTYQVYLSHILFLMIVMYVLEKEGRALGELAYIDFLAFVFIVVSSFGFAWALRQIKEKANGAISSRGEKALVGS